MRLSGFVEGVLTLAPLSMQLGLSSGNTDLCVTGTGRGMKRQYECIELSKPETKRGEGGLDLQKTPLPGPQKYVEEWPFGLC